MTVELEHNMTVELTFDTVNHQPSSFFEQKTRASLSGAVLCIALWYRVVPCGAV